MNLFDILSHNERVIVFSDEGDRIIYTWNKSQTLQVWIEKYNYNTDQSTWEETNIRTLESVPTFEGAVKAAQVWHNE